MRCIFGGGSITRNGIQRSANVVPRVTFIFIGQGIKSRVQFMAIPDSACIDALGCRHPSVRHHRIEQRRRDPYVGGGFRAGKPAWRQVRWQDGCVLGHADHAGITNASTETPVLSSLFTVFCAQGDSDSPVPSLTPVGPPIKSMGWKAAKRTGHELSECYRSFSIRLCSEEPVRASCRLARARARLLPRAGAVSGATQSVSISEPNSPRGRTKSKSSRSEKATTFL